VKPSGASEQMDSPLATHIWKEQLCPEVFGGLAELLGVPEQSSFKLDLGRGKVFMLDSPGCCWKMGVHSMWVWRPQDPDRYH
jgi:hypothetical protein